MKQEILSYVFFMNGFWKTYAYIEFVL